MVDGRRNDSTGFGWRWETGVWAFFVLAFMPAWQELGRHWLAQPWARYSVAFLALWIVEIWRGRPGPPRVTAGIGLVTVAVLAEIWCTVSFRPSWARIALVVGLVGVAIALGRPSRSRLLLAAWVIPIPSALLRQGLWPLETLLMGLGLELAIPTGAAQRGRIDLPEIGLALGPQDCGGALAVALAGGAVYAAALRGEQLRTLVSGALIGAGCGFALQMLSLAAAIAVAAAGAPEPARLLLSLLPWVTAVALAAAYWMWPTEPSTGAPSSCST